MISPQNDLNKTSAGEISKCRKYNPYLFFSSNIRFLDQYLSSLIKQDQEKKEKMQAILNFVKDNQVDYRKF